MVRRSITTRRSDGVTFVQVTVSVEERSRLRIEYHGDGTVLPPRRGGEPESGWNEGGTERVVDVGSSGIGFAVVEPVEPEDVELAVDPIPDESAGAVDAWFDRVDERLRCAEEIAAARTLEEATAAVAAAGGLGAVERLAAAVVRDRRLLERIETAPDALLERAERTELPTAELRRLA